MSTLNVGTANATTVNVGTGGIVFNDSTSLTTAPSTSLALNDLTNVTAPSPQTEQVLQWNGSAWVNADASGGIEEGTTAQRPGSPTGSSMRYNTDYDVLESYFRNGGENNRAGWYAAGGRQLIAHYSSGQGSLGSIDINWGTAAGQNNSTYWGYEIHMSFYENPDNRCHYYMRFKAADGQVKSGSDYYYNHEGWCANDGVYSRNDNPAGEIYLSAPSSYSQDGGENVAHTSFQFFLHNCPNSRNARDWSFFWHGAHSRSQEGGGACHMDGGGGWTGGTQSSVRGQTRPIQGFRLYYGGQNTVAVDGVHTIISVFGIAGFEGNEFPQNYGNHNN